MTKVNKQFIKAMQIELDKKEKIFVGKLYYKNMPEHALKNRLYEKMTDYFKFRLFWNRHALQNLLVHIANFCWMLWERLGFNNENK